MEEKILDFIMEYAQEHENVPFQVIEETFNIQMDERFFPYLVEFNVKEFSE